MDELNNADKVILKGVNGGHIELSKVYSIKSFFEDFLLKCEEGERFYASIIGEARAKKVNKMVEKICEYQNHECFKEYFINSDGKAKNVSQFYNGYYEAGNIRKKYLLYLTDKKNLNEEKQRMRGFLSPLFDNGTIENIYKNIEDFLGERNENQPLNIGNFGRVYEDVEIIGFFEEIEKFSNNRYKGKNINYHNRFNKAFEKNPLEATAGLFILIMLGGWAGQAVEWLFPLDEYIDKAENEIIGEMIYNEYLNSDDHNAKALFKEAFDLYCNGNKATEICYVLGKLRMKYSFISFIDKTTNRKEQAEKDFKECISVGEDLSKNDVRCDIEKNYLEVVAKAAYEVFSIKYKEQIGNYENSEILRKQNKKIISYLKKAAQYNHPDACNIIGDLLLVDYLADSDFQFSNKYKETISNLKSWKINGIDCLDNKFLNEDEKELKAIDKAIEYFEKAGDGHAYLRKAQCLEKKEESREQICLMWAEAYKRGENDAKKKIMEYKDLEQKNLDDESSDFISEGKRICILCSCSKENQMFAKTLPNNYQIILIKNLYESFNILSEIDKKKGVITIKDSLSDAFQDTVLLRENKFEFDEIRQNKLESDDIGENKFELNDIIESKVIKNEVIEDEIIIVDYGDDIQHKCERLEILFSYVKRLAKKYTDKYFISDRIKLCIDLSESMTELHIDRLERELEDLYIPIYDNMYEKNASMELLSKLPLFAMDMNPEKIKKERHIVILGHTNAAIQIMKDMVSVCVAEPDVYYYIHLVDLKADCVKKLFLGQCDEIVQNNKEVNYKLEFNTVDELEYLNSLVELEYLNVAVDLDTMEDVNVDENNITKNDKDNKEDNKIKFEKILLADCDYFVCATDDDMLNINLARKIRTWSMRSTKSYYDIPLIAVLNKDKKLCESLEGMAITTTIKIEYPWYEGLNLVSFGALQNYYSYKYMNNNWIKNWGMAVDLAYCNKKRFDELHSGYNEFYSRWYNRDSSYMSAFFFIYRLYNAGMYKKWFKWDFYAFADNINQDSSELLKNYNQYIQNPKRREDQAKLEHARWCEWIKSRGWKKQKDDNQVENYMRCGNGAVKHQLHTAKIHPYIIAWEQLGERIIDKMIFELEELKYNYDKIVGIADEFGISKYVDQKQNELEKLLNFNKDEEVKKKIQHVINDLEKIIEEKINRKKTENETKTKSVQAIKVEENIQICINRLNEILASQNFESTGLQAKMEKWYEKFLGRQFTSSTKGHNRMIVSRTSEFIKEGQRMIKEKEIGYEAT